MLLLKYYAGHLVSFSMHVNILYRVVSYRINVRIAGRRQEVAAVKATLFTKAWWPCLRCIRFLFAIFRSTAAFQAVQIKSLLPVLCFQYRHDLRQTWRLYRLFHRLPTEYLSRRLLFPIRSSLTALAQHGIREQSRPSVDKMFLNL